MKSKNYRFIILTVVCFAMLSAEPSYVQASHSISDEIDKYVSSSEEKRPDEQAQQNFSLLKVTEIDEEQPESEEEKTSEDETETQDSETIEEKHVEEQTAPAPTVTPELKKEETVPEKTQKIKEEPAIKEEKPAEEPVAAEQPKQPAFSLSEFFDDCSKFFSEMFEKITEMKDSVVEYFSSEEFASLFDFDKTEAPQEIEAPQEDTNTRKMIPYYFINPEPVNKHYERIFFSGNISNPRQFLPFRYALKYYEVDHIIEAPKNAVTSEGTTDFRVLLNAPSPKIEVLGKPMFAKLVIDIGNNTLYKYDENGFPLKAYLVATGARGTRTYSGLRVVTYKEKFPYSGAPANCKRLTDPYSYGPYIIFWNRVNPRTGKKIYIDQFLHGNGNERSIGRKVSHGCVRMNNKVMRQEMSKEVNRGDYILLINPDRN